MQTTEYLTLFTRHQTGRGLSPQTCRRRMISLRLFAASILPVDMLSATPELVEEWLFTHRSTATRRAYRSDLMAFYVWADKRGLCASNPVLRTDSIKVPKGLPRPVPAELLSAILVAAPPDVRRMIALAAYAGLRCAEIAALDRADINLIGVTPTLAVRNGKGGKDRIVPVHPVLAVLLEGLPAGPVVNVTSLTVGIKVATHLRSLGVNATCHQLRHTFGTELARATDGNVILVAKLMGHESIQTSMLYIGWAGGPGQIAVEAMYPAA